MKENREILFRGKTVGTKTVTAGKWIYGALVQTDKGCYILESAADFSYGDNGSRIRIGCFKEVDPETVGQYTGLEDKNGTKIFEGDIIKGAWSTELEVFFDDDYLQFRARNAEYKSREIDYFGQIEIIGNIHDNPIEEREEK